MAIAKKEYPNTFCNAAMEIYSDTIALASVAANITANQEVAASSTGLLKVGDLVVILDQGGVQAGIAIDALPVDVADSWKLKVHNLTAGAITPTSTTMTFLVIHVGSLI